LLNRSEQYDDRGNNREQSTSARQAAEALFAPKPQRVEPTVREASPAGEAVRKPRVLAVAIATPVPHDAPEAPTRGKPPREPIIPAAYIARIHAWLKYGMTVAQMAEMYGVAASEVERILSTVRRRV
jgi:hypothetical protein